MRQLTLLSLALLLLLGACESPPQQPAPASTRIESATPQAADASFFGQPQQPHFFELPTEAIPVWRKHAVQQPALVIFNFDPLLHEFPPQLTEAIKTMVTADTAEQFLRQGNYYRNLPLLLPPQTLRAVLEAKFFSAIYWVYPPLQQPAEQDLENFKQQLAGAAILSEQERNSLALQNGQVMTQVAGIPFYAVHPDTLPLIEGPLLLHIDLGYFAKGYADEIKTPSYGLLKQLLEQLQQTRWQPLEITLSASNSEGIISTDFRFLIHDLQRLLQQPELLNEQMPRTWQLRADALYQAAMYNAEQAKKNYRDIVTTAPNDAAGHYDLYRSGDLQKNRNETLAHLQRAVALDPGYAWSYINLAVEELQNQQLKAAISLLEKAAAADPLNSITKFELAKRLVEDNRDAEAGELLEELSTLQWSEIYHPDFPLLIEQLQQTVAR